ncbi:MAG: hypothetical protein JXR58_08760 [Bacteroidales bacterium]|nr:hypothetical protein [Bacteroidales bacterium]
MKVIFVLTVFLSVYCQSQNTVKYFAPSDTVYEECSICQIDNVFFNLSGGGGVRPESYSELDSVGAFIMKNPKIQFELGVHTDCRPISFTNDTLSLMRARSCVFYILEKNNNISNITYRGYGSKIPYTIMEKDCERFQFFNVGDLLTKEYIDALENDEQKQISHQLNRRTELRILRIE